MNCYRLTLILAFKVAFTFIVGARSDNETKKRMKRSCWQSHNRWHYQPHINHAAYSYFKTFI